MNIKIRHTPFKISNDFYNYQNLTNEELEIKKGRYYVIFQFEGYSTLKNFKNEKLNSNEYIEFIAATNQKIKLNNGTGVVLSKDNANKNLSEKFQFFGCLKNDAYYVNKPWGYEYWITGKDPLNNVVLKFIHIMKGTKTSLQVHH